LALYNRRTTTTITPVPDCANRHDIVAENIVAINIFRLVSKLIDIAIHREAKKAVVFGIKNIPGTLAEMPG
jgi:hypothetical protein